MLEILEFFYQVRTLGTALCSTELEKNVVLLQSTEAFTQNHNDSSAPMYAA